MTPEERAEVIVMTASGMNKITVDMIIPHIREAELAATERAAGIAEGFCTHDSECFGWPICTSCGIAQKIRDMAEQALKGGEITD